MDEGDFRAVTTWIERRRGYVQLEGYAWAADDPVVGCLAPWLHLLARDGQLTLEEAARQKCAAVYYRSLGRRSAWQASLAGLMAALDRAGIERMGLKGAVLAETLYPDPGLRQMGDVDLLVRRRDFARAAHLLLAGGLSLSPENGFRSPDALDALPAEAWPNEVIFCGPAGLVVELHSHLLASDWFQPAFPVEVDPVWQRARHLPLGGLWSDEMSAYDLLAHLALHQAMHGLQAMHVYVDVDRFLRRLPEDWDWEAAYSRLEEWGLRPAAFHVMRFCQAFMDTPAPEAFLARLDPGRAHKRRLDGLISPQDVLAVQSGKGGRRPAGVRRPPGIRYPTLVKLGLVEASSGLLPALRKVLLPGQDWLLRRYPQRPSLITHWAHVLRVVRRGD